MQKRNTPAVVCTLLVMATAVHAQNWVSLTPLSGSKPAPRRNAAAIYDSLQHRMVLFGGRTDTGDRNDVWAFHLHANAWLELTPSPGPAPAPRFTASAVYDAARQQMIIWSGQGASFFNDVWSFDLQQYTWTALMPPEPRPNARYGTASVFDPRGRELVAFAGFTDQGRFEDTWRFNVDHLHWTEVSPANAHPDKRCLHTASYDPRDHRMIIYGGQSSGALRDIWAFDLRQNSWANLTPSETPDGRWFPASIYDSRNHRFMIFGGNFGSSKTNEVWAFALESNAWQQLTLAGTAPSGREGASAIHVESEDRMLIFGGRAEAHNNELWALENLSATVSVNHPQPATPQSFRLFGNYPNPFNPRTAIAYEIPRSAQVSVKLYGAQGQLIKVLFGQIAHAGRHELVWDTTNQSGQAVGSGVYLYTIRFGSTSRTGKMILAK